MSKVVRSPVASLPGGRRTEQILVCGALAAVVACLVLVAIVSMQMLSAARGYTQGEALWSKGQKDAILQLLRYAQTRSESDYQGFRAAIHVPLACRTVRLQMDRAQPDAAILRRGFSDIGIADEDRSRIVWLYRNFRWAPPLARAVSTWENAEAEIFALEAIGERMHRLLAAGTTNQKALAKIVIECYRINRDLTPLEAQFSQSLGKAGRWLHTCLISVLLTLSSLLVVAGCVAYYVLLNRVTKSEEQYRHLIDTASEAILIADGSTGRVVDANRKAVELLGTSDLDSALLLARPDSPESTAPERMELAQIIGRTQETKLRSADGAWMDVEFTASAVEVSGGTLIQVIMRDVTERKKAAALLSESEQRYRLLSSDLTTARDRALDANHAKSQFLANISHEIRTPMNGVIGMISLALDKCADPEQKEQLEAAQSSAQSLVTILNDVLDLSRIEAGKMTIEAIDFNLHDVLDQTIRLFQPTARQKKIRVGLSVDPRCPSWVRGDPVRIRQVLVNLVGNAVKFTDRGEVEVRVWPNAEEVSFEIHDTGIGIPSGKLDAIFSPFTQADGSHTRQFGGTGLGLTITKRLVELMSGRVRVESTEGCGSSFFVELPLESRVPVRQTATAFTSGHHDVPTELHVLMAEDNLINQKVMSALLRRYGWTVEVVSNGKQAYQEFLKTSFDVILMDVQMPEMDGFEATRLIRARENAAASPSRVHIIAITAHASREQHDQCIAAGMDGVITKPLDPATFKLAILEALSNKEAGLIPVL